jgi:hypothetical protein
VEPLRRTSAWVLMLLTLGCGGEAVTTPGSRSTPPPVAAQLVAVSPDTTFADHPSWQVADPPVVCVLDSTGTHAVPNVAVTFTVTAGGGVVGQSTVYTDGDGLARAGSWQIGDTTATNTVVAGAKGLAPVQFTAAARLVIARFDLLKIGTDTLPYFVLDSTEAIVGGHYVLFNNGTATFNYDLASVTPSGLTPLSGPLTALSYVQHGQLDAGASIAFLYTPASLPSFHPFGNRFTYGESLNGVMTVTPVDIDFDAEIYRRVK